MILVIIFLLCALVITSLLESSYSSLNIIRIKKLMENKNKKAKMVYKLYSKYSEAITSILVVNCVCSVMVSSLTTYYFQLHYLHPYNYFLHKLYNILTSLILRLRYSPGIKPFKSRKAIFSLLSFITLYPNASNIFLI